MSSDMYTAKGQKNVPMCTLCGRSLGVGFYYTCHVCGASYCYAHIPEKCDHRRSKVPPIKVALRKS